ncbi:hypothetical protein K8Z61_05865 [Nocardioides sp. TRM66260-LWL]|uniref:hypothetical protein n=1 Tax=Nocardioides sp. TRM66260-LWL TaxID=2874478 RepID=UPI001CC67BE2|nr:hypothetical protein [Nocardioides sp. TRM66260-LWL]MBZ5734017.1 hypothetical protein [Nocardioides sp. TRM66260-LWL]
MSDTDRPDLAAARVRGTWEQRTVARARVLGLLLTVGGALGLAIYHLVLLLVPSGLAGWALLASLHSWRRLVLPWALAAALALGSWTLRGRAGLRLVLWLSAGVQIVHGLTLAPQAIGVIGLSEQPGRIAFGMLSAYVVWWAPVAWLALRGIEPRRG